MTTVEMKTFGQEKFNEIPKGKAIHRINQA